MKKGFTRALFAFALGAPIAAFAISSSDAQLQLLLSQVAALKSQIASLQEGSSVAPGVRICAVPTRNLSRGDEGEDVANLQIFLSRDVSIYPEGQVVGYFGPATERAVQRWQSKYGIISAGTAATTGYGAVGPRTLQLMNKLWSCAGPISVGWFTASVSGGSAAFSVQASSSLPLDTSIYIEAGDGTQSPVVISNSVCKTLGGQCSSVMTARHDYASGAFTATLRRKQTTQSCIVYSQTCVDGIGICGNLQPSCSTRTTVEVLATTTIASNGATTASTTSGAGGTFSISGVTSTVNPSIRVLAPQAGSAALLGGSLTVSWSGSYAPAGATVKLLLKNVSGTTVGTIASGQKTVGTYWWNLPAPSGAPCTADAFTCLTQLAQPTCSGGICSLETGAYTIVAQVVLGSTVVATAQSSPFSVVATTVSYPTFIASTSSSGSTGSYASTSSEGSYGALPGTGTTVAASCLYSGVPYGNGITLQVGCTDVAGLTCGSFGTLSLTCQNGTWVDGSGAAAYVPNVTMATSTSGTCTTPWGSQKVQSGNQITYEPFFTGGQYTGNTVVPLMQCTAGRWQKCNWDGTGCVNYTVI